MNREESNVGAQPNVLGRLRIVMWAGGMPFDGDTVLSESLGGSESAAYYLAKELGRRGHAVFVFTSKPMPAPMVRGNVVYLWHGEVSQESPMGSAFEQYALNTPHDVLIAQRVPYAFNKHWASKINVWQLHDLALHRGSNSMLGGMYQVDAVTCVSDWHAKQVREVWNINPEVLRVVPNGVDPDLYAGPVDDEVPLPQGKFILLYQSRPERGLANLLKPGGIMEKLHNAGVPVHLVHCTYSAGTVPHLRGFYAQLNAWSEALPNVTNLGALPKAKLAGVQRRCDMLVYPTEFEEVSCITAMEAMHAYLPMMTTPVAALPETCKDAGVLFEPIEGFADKLAELFSTRGTDVEYPQIINDLRSAQREASKTRTWSVAADKLEAVIGEAFAKRQSSQLAIVRNAIEHSDIEFARWYLREHCHESNPALISAAAEIGRLYAFTDSQEAYSAHYAKHQTAYYDEFEDRVIGEDVTGSTRFRAVKLHLDRIARDRPDEPLRVLDYGCAHGHYSIPLAKMFPEWEFVGVDISSRAIAAATKWAQREDLPNVEFRQGSQSMLDYEQLGYFDIVLAGEVLEHVKDYSHLLDLFSRMLNTGGALVISTPTGRWEHSGTEAFRTGREHLHHFDRADIEDICARHPHEIVHAPASHDRSGFALGSYVWCVWPRPDLPLWPVDYKRKLRTYAPRQAISACMIVRNGETTLRRCVESFIDWVDELIICIDPSTTDRTEAICEQIQADYPNRPVLFAVAEKSAIRDGFDEARNECIGKASGDWIMWLDADEEIRTPWNLHKLLRPSMHNGFGFPQIHYAVEPAQVITTDYPCRVFRNHRGIKFYGVVHEHPESELGKAVTWSLVRNESAFLHSGYYDEETRRKRFQRNLPLLLRDLEKHPENRPLNRFLYLRDLAQTIAFEQERGGPTAHHADHARKGIEIMEQIADQPQLRMIGDALQYYSHCVVSSGMPSFEAEVSVKSMKEEAPALSASLSFKGRFHSREFYLKIVNRFAQESCKLYEDRYL